MADSARRALGVVVVVTGVVLLAVLLFHHPAVEPFPRPGDIYPYEPMAVRAP